MAPSSEQSKIQSVTKPVLRNQPLSVHYDAFLVVSVASTDKLVAEKTFVLGS